ncbi:MAG: M20/M25/M40 family metallo-hydrolase [Acidobacteriota bacterium]
MLKNRSFLLFIVAAGGILISISSAVPAQKPVLKISTKDEIAEDIKAVPCKNGDRLEAVKTLFKKMGAADSDMSVETQGSIHNLVVTKRGTSDEIVIIGAHYDKVSEGCGAIDNWTGITIIAHLFRTMNGTTPAKTYRFVAFDSEESGLKGSDAMAKAITKESRPNYCSMINFDSFGFTYPSTFSNGSSPKMVAVAKTLSAELKIPFADARIEGADADSSSFLARDIPAITFDGLGTDWQKYLHTSNDKVGNVNISSVFVGYSYALRYVGIVDAAACGEYRKK